MGFHIYANCFARRCEPSASEYKSQCECESQWTKLGVLFTLKPFWLTSQPFWQVTIGFPRWQKASSRPSLLPPFLKLYKVIRYNTIQLQYHYNTIRYNTSSFPQVIRPRLPGPLHIRGRISHQANPCPPVACYSTLHFAYDLVWSVVLWYCPPVTVAFCQCQLYCWGWAGCWNVVPEGKPCPNSMYIIVNCSPGLRTSLQHMRQFSICFCPFCLRFK